MSNDTIKAIWQREDAWILMCMFLGCGPDGCDLERIVGVADYIDRSYPTVEQLNGALNRLAAGRLITSRKGRFFVTKPAWLRPSKPTSKAIIAKCASCQSRAAV